MRKIISKMRAEEGQGIVEYALILVLISIVCILALTAIGTGINSAFSTIAATL
jgi:pilus assembly protein Flp/PilA